MNHMFRTVGAALVGVMLTGSVGFAQSSTEALYKLKCQMCHGEKGMADSAAGKSMKVKPISDPDVKKMNEAQMVEAEFSIRLKRDGTLEATPTAASSAPTPYVRVYQESALRAIIECQPYNLPAAYFDEWKFFAPVFTERRT